MSVDNSAAKAMILAQIAVVNGKIQVAQSLVSSFSGQQSACGNHITKWNTARKSTLTTRITKEILVGELFDGDTANRQKNALTDALDTMEDNITKAETVETAIGGQIGALNTYINNLNNTLSQLWATYYAL